MTNFIGNLLKKILPDWIYGKLIGRWNSSGLRRYAGNTLWSLSARVVSLLVSFFVTIYLVRYLGPENYGQLSYAISFVGLFSILSTLGIDNILYRDLIKYADRRDEYLGSALVLKLIAGAIASGLTVFFAFTLSTDDVSRLVIILLSLTFLFNAFNIINYEFQADVAQKYTSLVSMFVVFFLNFLKVVIILLGEGIIYIACILLLEAVLYAGLFATIRLRHYGSLFKWRFNKSVCWQLLSDSWPFIFITAFATIYTRIDQVMLKGMVSPEAVGLYDAAVRISEMWLFVPAIVASSLFPAIVNARKSAPNEYKKRLIILTGLLVSFGLLIAVPLTLLSGPVIQLLYGSAFLASASVLAIYVWAGVFASVDIVVRYFLITENQRVLIFLTTMGTAMVNVFLNLLFIPQFGIIGAAWSTLISYMILIVPFLLILRIRN